jgi:hypothetical protein
MDRGSPAADADVKDVGFFAEILSKQVALGGKERLGGRIMIDDIRLAVHLEIAICVHRLGP